MLFDCGEGTQRQLLRSSIGLVDLEEIFVTHFHADHYSRPARDAEDLLAADARGAAHGLRAARAARSVRCARARLRAADLPGRAPSSSAAGDRLEVATATRICAFFRSDHRVLALGYALVEEERPGRFDDGEADRARRPVLPVAGRAPARARPVTLADGRIVEPAALVGAPARRPHDRLHRRHGGRGRRRDALPGCRPAHPRGDVHRRRGRDALAETGHSTALQAGAGRARRRRLDAGAGLTYLPRSFSAPTSCCEARGRWFPAIDSFRATST